MKLINKESVKLINQFSKKYRFQFLILFACIIITNILGSLYPLILGRIVDEVFYNNDVSKFARIVVIYLLVFAFNQLFHFLLNYVWVQIATTYLFDIRKAVFSKVLKLHGIELENLNTGDLIYRIREDVRHFLDIIHWSLFYGIGSLAEISFSIVLVSSVNKTLAFVIIIFLPLVTSISKYYSRMLAVRYKKLESEKGSLISWCYELIQNMDLLKLMNSIKRVQRIHARNLIGISRNEIEITKLELISERIAELLMLVCSLIIFSISAFFIKDNVLTIGGFVSIVAYFNKTAFSYKNLNGTFSDIARSAASIDRIREILEKESETDIDPVTELNNQALTLEFSRVSYSYGHNQLLSDINLKCNQNDVIAIVGESGCGKSTMINLINRIYTIDRGEILFCNENVNKIKLSKLRDIVGIVNQNISIFDGTIRYNLVFTDDPYKDDEISNVLKKVGLDKYVKNLESGIDTQISSRVLELSNGERQRFGIARVLLKNPSIVILDESTSNLDAKTEQLVQETIHKLKENKIVIVIAHNPQTILHADKVAIIKNGRVLGFDTHEVLINRNYDYRRFFKNAIEMNGN